MRRPKDMRQLCPPRLCKRNYRPRQKSYGTIYEKLAPCLIQAVEPDAGDAVVYFTENGNCRYHADAFEKSEDYIEQCELEEEQWPVAAC